VNEEGSEGEDRSYEEG